MLIGRDCSSVETIVKADDHAVAREGNRQIPEQESDLSVVAEADTIRAHGYYATDCR